MIFRHFFASLILFAVKFVGCFIFISLIIFLNLFLSSAISIEFREVPKIFIPSLTKCLARFKGVCPPNCNIKPRRFPFLFSTFIISITSSGVKGSKYNLSEVS